MTRPLRSRICMATISIPDPDKWNLKWSRHLLSWLSHEVCQIRSRIPPVLLEMSAYPQVTRAVVVVVVHGQDHRRILRVEGTARRPRRHRPVLRLLQNLPPPRSTEIRNALPPKTASVHLGSSSFQNEAFLLLTTSSHVPFRAGHFDASMNELARLIERVVI